MNIEIFYTLKEIQSLHLACQKNLQHISEEEKRLNQLQTKMDDKVQEKRQQEQLLAKTVEQINSLEKKLTQRLETSIQERSEKELWEMMVKQEEEELLLKDIETFIHGYSKTLQELKTEIQHQIDLYQQEINSNQNRINLLLQELPEEIQKLVKSRQALNLKVSLFTKTTSQGCYICQRTLSRLEMDEIDVQLKVKACPGCQRIFLPYQVVSG